MEDSVARSFKQGEIHLCKAQKKSGDTKVRPVVVIARPAILDGERTVSVVPLSTDPSQRANDRRTQNDV